MYEHGGPGDRAVGVQGINGRCRVSTPVLVFHGLWEWDGHGLRAVPSLLRGPHRRLPFVRLRVACGVRDRGTRRTEEDPVGRVAWLPDAGSPANEPVSSGVRPLMFCAQQLCAAVWKLVLSAVLFFFFI
jgi:hypothetical protein